MRCDNINQSHKCSIKVLKGNNSNCRRWFNLLAGPNIRTSSFEKPSGHSCLRFLYIFLSQVSAVSGQGCCLFSAGCRKSYVFSVLEAEFLLSMDFNIAFLRWMCGSVIVLNRDPPLSKYRADGFLSSTTVCFKPDLEE